MRRSVSATGKRIEFLARAIVNRLEDRGLMEFSDAEAVIIVVAKTLGDNFAAVAAIEDEARHRLGDRATESQVEQEMQRIAAQRDFIL
jgi:hypothetical protein